MNFSLNLSCRIFHRVLTNFFWLVKNGTFTLFFAQPLCEFFARIRCFTLSYTAQKTDRKKAVLAKHKKDGSTVFSPTCITNSKNPFFVLVFCIGPRYTQGYDDDDLTTKCSCSLLQHFYGAKIQTLIF